MPRIIKCALWIALAGIANALLVSGDTYRLVRPIDPDLVVALHPCDIGCLTIIDVGETYGSDMYEVEGVVSALNCKKQCFKYNIPAKDGQMMPLVSKLHFKEFDCKVFGNEVVVTVPWNTRKLPPGYVYPTGSRYPDTWKGRQVTSVAQLSAIPDDNVKTEVPGIVLRLDCLKSDGSITSYPVIYGQFETIDGKVNKKRSNSANRTRYTKLVHIVSLVLAIQIILLSL